ncbi:MAG: dihydrolipoyl dehydrogenase [Pirellulales bacterium]|nr:dihydrolipoyl dehydrogenase [Pirellulales bacterium]
MHSQVVVLGGGPGGYAAAFMAADLGLHTTIIEQEPKLGGVCLLRGCIPSKALLHVARVISESSEMAEWGVEFQEPVIDVDRMRARKEKVIDALSGGLSQLAEKRNVEVIRARGVFEDSKRIRLEGVGDDADHLDAITYDHCIVAAGSRPAVPKMFDLETDRVMDSTGALDLADVPESLLVVGGGYIGLEMGTVYAELGSKVTVVEMMDQLLPGADADLVKPLAKRLKGVMESILLKTKVTSMTDKGDSIEVELEGEETSGAHRFDRVLVSIGRRPNSDLLGLENTQVKLDDRGFIITDEQRRSHDPAIFAIGDIAGEPMLAHKAGHEGKVAAEAIAGHPITFDKRAIPAVVFTDPEIAWAGITVAEAKRDGVKHKVAQYPWAASGRAQAVGRTEGMTKIVFDPDSEQVLGVGIVGVGAGELIAEGTLAIEMGCSARDLAETIHAHPTMAETVGHAADVQLGFATEVYRPRRNR